MPPLPLLLLIKIAWCVAWCEGLIRKRLQAPANKFTVCFCCSKSSALWRALQDLQLRS